MASTSPVFVENVTQGTVTISLTAKTVGNSNQNYTFAAVLTPSRHQRDLCSESRRRELLRRRHSDRFRPTADRYYNARRLQLVDGDHCV